MFRGGSHRSLPTGIDADTIMIRCFRTETQEIHEEIAKLALFLVCDEISYSTGSEFLPDSGLLAGLLDGVEN